MRPSTPLFVALAAASSLHFVAAQQALSGWTDGIATNYGGAADGMSPGSPSFGTSEGSCGYGLLDKNKWPFWSVGALATSNQFFQAGPLNGCGQCFEVKCVSTVDKNKGACTSSSVLIQITDSCPECASDQFDIQALTFDKLAPMNVGRMNIQYRRVECTPPDDLEVAIDANSGAGGWVRLNVQQTGGRGAIKAIQMQGSDGAWQQLNNIFGAEWESASQATGDINLRFHPDQGQPVTANNVYSGSKTGLIPTKVQFPSLSGSSSSASASSGGASASSSGDGQVQAFSGPPDNSQPSSSPPPSSSSGSWSDSSSNGGGSPPPGSSSGGNGGSSSSPSPPPQQSSSNSGRRLLRRKC